MSLPSDSRIDLITPGQVIAWLEHQITTLERRVASYRDAIEIMAKMDEPPAESTEQHHAVDLVSATPEIEDGPLAQPASLYAKAFIPVIMARGVKIADLSRHFRLSERQVSEVIASENSGLEIMESGFVRPLGDETYTPKVDDED